MPSPRDAARALALALLLAAGAATQAAEAPTRQQVREALDKVRADPDLPGTQTRQSLRFKDRAKDKKPRPALKKAEDAPSGKDKGFFSVVADVGRVLIWALGALALGWVLLRLRHWVRMRADAGPRRRGALPSHVGTLDIRPESLPEGIGDAAAALWQRGQQRAALSLLYRGALSRLVHVQGVPIRAASTEGECVALARDHLPAAAQQFFAALVQAWQLAAYGARLPDTGAMLALCGAFDQQLPDTPAPPPAAQGAPA